MSAKKSFDVRRKRNVPKKTARRAGAAPRPKKSLRSRREDARNRSFLFFCIGALGAVVLALFLAWRPEVRISEVTAPNSPIASSLEEIAHAKLKGTYGGLIPRDSIFFYPEREIRSAILKQEAHLSNVSIARAGFSSLTIAVTKREPAFLWCGTPDAALTLTRPCYLADDAGLVFSSVRQDDTAGTPLLNVYAMLDTASTTDAYPLRARVIGTSLIPDILRFARAVEAMGIPLTAIAIRGDEADLYTKGGTRITYVVGQETSAAEAAKASLPKLNLMDGSVLYVDLRFDDKAYVKRRGN